MGQYKNASYSIKPEQIAWIKKSAKVSKVGESEFTRVMIDTFMERGEELTMALQKARAQEMLRRTEEKMEALMKEKEVYAKQLEKIGA